MNRNSRIISAFLVATAGAPLVAQPSGAPAEAVSAPAPAAAPVSLADYAKVPFITQPRISPDGNSFSGLVSVEGKPRLAVLNLFDVNTNPIFLGLPEGTNVAWIRWVNNDNLIVGLYALLPMPGGERSHVSRLIAVNRKSGKITKLLWDRNGQNAADVVWTASDGSPEILVSAQNSIFVGADFWPAVYRVNAETGKVTRMIGGRPQVLDWFADSAGRVRAGALYDNERRQYRLLYRSDSEELFRTVDTADLRKDQRRTTPFLFLPGTDRAFALHDNDKGRTAIYEIDLKTQADLRTVFAAPDGSEVDQVFISSDGKTLLGASYSGDRNGVEWFDPVLKQVQQDVDKSIGDRHARIVSMSDDRSRLLLLLDRPDWPGALYFFDIRASKMQRIAFINSGIGARRLNPAKLVRYKARDGLKIEAVVTLPRDRPARGLPVIMLPHGGPWAQDTLSYDYWAQFLAGRGYAVIQPNFRGSTGYGSEFMKRGEGQMGLAMQDDITDGLAWAVKEGIADPKRACIVGASYGGYAAMWGIAKDPDLYRCAVSIAGVANVRREVNDFGDYVLGGIYRDQWQRMSPDFPAISPINAIARIKVPLLLIHGKKDITVDFVQSSAMFAKMRGAGKAVELVALPEADHHFLREADRVTLLTSLDAFLTKHNPPDPAPR